MNGQNIHVSAMKVEVLNTTTAGDCFVGVLASSMNRGLSLEDAMKRATIGAAIACTRAGS
ncbi:PfkB family carbohydrate kinase [Paenochrobactrum glaciei]|uniref:Carbohydrate kinase PfkB domain-containing protein n=1 Tax=Paenochrobactrum glaciei TaxID=486407 RepID=A0ABN1GKJ8_9HYPH